MNTNKILVEFEVGERYARKQTFRILRSLGDNGRLFLEELTQDLMGTNRWSQVPFKEVLGAGMFKDHSRWRALWDLVSIPVKWDGSIVDTRGEANLPRAYRGVVHAYSTRNDHAPNDDNQDAYVVGERRGLEFSNKVQVLELLDEERAVDLFLGVLYVLVRREQEDRLRAEGL